MNKFIFLAAMVGMLDPPPQPTADKEEEPLPPQTHDDFYSHLHECSQCRDRPFALCRKGTRIMESIGANMVG
jgi:hypothetical protein